MGAYHTTNVALFDSMGGLVDCNPGPGGGDYWGRVTQSLGAGDWYAVSDGAVAPDKSVADRRGNFQLRFRLLREHLRLRCVYPTSTTAQSYDVGDELLTAGQSNFMPFLRVRAKLQASSDSLSTPIFQGWSMEFNCVPFD